jgi:hypothetical protein
MMDAMCVVRFETDSDMIHAVRADYGSRTRLCTNRAGNICSCCLKAVEVDGDFVEK